MRFPKRFNSWHSNTFKVHTLLSCLLIMLALLLAACGEDNTMNSAQATSTAKAITTTGKNTQSSPSAQQAPGFVTYHKGRVQLSSSAYLIFWGPEWQSNTNLNAARQALGVYFSHVGGSSYQSVLTQYYMQDSAGARSYISNTTHFSTSQVWVDPAEPKADDQSCGGPTISDASVLHEISHAITAANWQKDTLNATYFVYTPPSFAIAEPGWGCSGKDFCADHEWSSQMQVSYAVDPANCSRPGSLADKLVWTSAHEQFESITDPTPGRSNDTLYQNEGWFHADPSLGAEEIGDLCTRIQKTYNLNGMNFHLQSMWSNRDNRCV